MDTGPFQSFTHGGTRPPYPVDEPATPFAPSFKGQLLYSCDGLSVYQTTDGHGEPVAFVRILGNLGSTVSPQDAIKLADALHDAFEAFRLP